MLIKYMTLFSTLQTVSLSLITLPVPRNSHFQSCFRTILQKHIAQGTNLVVSFPAYTKNTLLTSSKTDTSQLIDSVLWTINGQTGLPVHVYQMDPKRPDIYPLILPYKPDSYVILTEEMGLSSIFFSHLGMLTYETHLNHKARFIFVVSGCFANINQSLNEAIYSLSQDFGIANFLFMIPRRDSHGCDNNEDTYGSVDTSNIDIYSWFPFKGNYCADNFDAVLIHQCGCENLDTFLHNVSLFPNKIPQNFPGCTLWTSFDVINPYVMFTDNYTDSDRRTLRRLGGFSGKFLSLVTEALNMTLGYCIDDHECVGEQIPYPIILSVEMKQQHFKYYGFDEYTTPYLFDTFKWFVPCAKSALRTDRILNLFSSSIWFTMLLVIVLTALVFWSSVRLLLGAVKKESYDYRTVVHCLYNVWCVSMGVSVPEMPMTWRVRGLFVLFVWYSFAMSTIFGSFFTSFLVSPGYVSRISSLNDLNHSSLKYCSSGPIDTALWHSDYSEHARLSLDRIEVDDPDICMERTLIEGDTTCVASTFIAQFVATQIGKRTDKNMLCTLDENIFSINMVFRFTRGLRVSERFNTVIIRCIEAGLGDKYWSDLLLNLTLQNMKNSEESDCQACSNNYFVFSLTHLRVAFIALGFGYVLSVAVFVAELICNWLSKRRTVTVKKPETPPFPFLH